jgi:histidinol-phosphate aminotransferase
VSRKASWFGKRLEETQRIREYSREEYLSATEPTDLKARDLIKLNSNENLFIPKSSFSLMFKEVLEELDPRLYPQSEKIDLIRALSDYLSLPSECFTIGNGSDELIETAVSAFLRGTERAVSIVPTFAMYEIIVEAHGSIYDTVPLGNGFSLDADALLSKITPKTVLCILCSPNNPTGNQFELSSVRKVVKEFKGIVIVDEAYVEFAPFSIKEAIKDFDNLIILRTFSKAFGLAGLRIGYAIACSEVTAILRRIQLPWNINKVSLRMATKVLEKKEFFL